MSAINADHLLVDVAGGAWGKASTRNAGCGLHESCYNYSVRLDSNQEPRHYEKTGLSNPCWPSMTYTCC